MKISNLLNFWPLNIRRKKEEEKKRKKRNLLLYTLIPSSVVLIGGGTALGILLTGKNKNSVIVKSMDECLNFIVNHKEWYNNTSIILNEETAWTFFLTNQMGRIADDWVFRTDVVSIYNLLCFSAIMNFYNFVTPLANQDIMKITWSKQKAKLILLSDFNLGKSDEPRLLYKNSYVEFINKKGVYSANFDVISNVGELNLSGKNFQIDHLMFEDYYIDVDVNYYLFRDTLTLERESIDGGVLELQFPNVVFERT